MIYPKIEPKAGEVFKYKDKKYLTVAIPTKCIECAMRKVKGCYDVECFIEDRKDEREVVFKEIIEIGAPQC